MGCQDEGLGLPKNKNKKNYQAHLTAQHWFLAGRRRRVPIRGGRL